MPITAQALVRAAMRDLDVLSDGETPSSSSETDCIDRLNQMLHGFPMIGIHVDHTDLAASDTVLWADRYIEALRHLVAERIAGLFVVTLTADQQRQAAASRRQLQAEFYTPGRRALDPALSHFSATRGRGVGYDIDSDSA